VTPHPLFVLLEMFWQTRSLSAPFACIIRSRSLRLIEHSPTFSFLVTSVIVHARHTLNFSISFSISFCPEHSLFSPTSVGHFAIS